MMVTAVTATPAEAIKARRTHLDLNIGKLVSGIIAREDIECVRRGFGCQWDVSRMELGSGANPNLGH